MGFGPFALILRGKSHFNKKEYESKRHQFKSLEDKISNLP